MLTNVTYLSVQHMQMASQKPDSRLFTQPSIQALIKENIKALAFVRGIHW